MRSLEVPLGGALIALCALVTAAHAGAPISFTQEGAARGIVYQMTNWPNPWGYLGWGCGFADLDGDGDPDVVVIGALDQHVGIFENDGTGHFTDRSAGWGIGPVNSGSGFAAADYDGDGDLDLYITQVGESQNELYPNVLARNDGAFHFTDVTVAANVDDLGPAKGPCWGDFDGDGWVDLFVPTYNNIVPGTGAMSDKLFRNLGDGTFEDVSVAQGVNDIGYGFQAVWFDYDKDGDVDLYLSNDRGHLAPNFRGNQLWRNDDGQLVNVSTESGTGLHLFSMGLACGDFDLNGWADLYVTNIPGGGGFNNPLMLNQGDGTFVEASLAAGVDNPWDVCWGATFFDYDNTGTPELYVNNQWQVNRFFVDTNGGFPCVELADDLNIQGPVHGFQPPSSFWASFTSAVADVDGDGDVDLLENNLGENVRLYINHEGSLSNWVKLHIVGVGPNTAAIGARVEASNPGIVLLRELLAGGNGYLGQNDLDVHLGLASEPLIQQVLVSWPGGSPTRTLTNLPANEKWTIYTPQRLGDANGDATVDGADFDVLAGCYDQPLQPGCEVMDFDGNSVIDAADASAFFDIYKGPALDCDGDRQIDLLQILVDARADANGNAVLDDCEAAGDVNGDGVVNVADLIVLLTGWGPCAAPCLGDTNGDGVVNVEDLVTVFVNWS